MMGMPCHSDCSAAARRCTGAGCCIASINCQVKGCPAADAMIPFVTCASKQAPSQQHSPSPQPMTPQTRPHSTRSLSIDWWHAARQTTSSTRSLCRHKGLRTGPPQSAATQQQSTAHSNLYAFELHWTYALYRIESRTVQDLIQKFESQNIGFLAQIGSLIEECLPVPHYY